VAITDKARAREYLRVSHDKSGRMRSTDEQHADNVTAAETHDWRLDAPYLEPTAVGASRRSNGQRRDFAKLLADLERDRFAADVLILWEPSRGSRRVSEWAALLEACETRRVLIYVTSHGKLYDPANPRDRRSLLEDAVDSEYEVERLSQRVTRTMAANAADGRPHGPTPFGYLRRYDPQTRRLIAQEPHPGEAPAVRELFDRLEAGHSLRSIALDFEQRGIRTRRGKPFSSQHLRAIALTPTYGGLRAYHPSAANKTGGHCRGLAGARSVVDAQWPALVPRAMFYSVTHRLTDEGRRVSRPGRAKHLLSTIAVCHVCGHVLTAQSRGGGQYRCAEGGHVRIGEAELDRYVESVLLAYLARPDVLDELRRGDDHDSELQRVRDTLAEARNELHALRAAVRAGQASVANLVEVEPGLITRVGDLEQQERELAAPPALAGLLTPGRDVRRRWKAAPMGARREVARLLLSPGLLGQVRVARSPVPGKHMPVEQRVVWRRDDGDHHHG
jgi:DNA invertase Pin-like site-specific DNA recombinase